MKDELLQQLRATDDLVLHCLEANFTGEEYPCDCWVLIKQRNELRKKIKEVP